MPPSDAAMQAAAKIADEQSHEGRRWRLWPLRLWIARDIMAWPVSIRSSMNMPETLVEIEREKVWFFRREWRSGANLEVRHRRLHSALYTVLLSGPRRGEARHRRLQFWRYVGAAACIGNAAWHATDPDPDLWGVATVALWSAMAVFWLGLARDWFPE